MDRCFWLEVLHSHYLHWEWVPFQVQWWASSWQQSIYRRDQTKILWKLLCGCQGFWSCTTTQMYSMFEYEFPVSSDTSHHNLITKIYFLQEAIYWAHPIQLRFFPYWWRWDTLAPSTGASWLYWTQILEAYKQAVDPSIEYKLVDENEHSEFDTKLRASRSNC